MIEHYPAITPKGRISTAFRSVQERIGRTERQTGTGVMVSRTTRGIRVVGQPVVTDTEGEGSPPYAVAVYL